MKISILIFTVIILISCSGKRNIEKRISISGAFALYPMAAKWAEEYKKIYPDIKIDISAGGAGKGVTDALSGITDLGMVSREISPEEIEKGAWYIAVTKDAVIPTISENNPFKDQLLSTGITKDNLEKIFKEKENITWDNIIKDAKQSNMVINKFTRSDACGAGEMWAKFLGTKQEKLCGTGVFGDPGMADAVKKDMYSIGYNNVIYVYDISTRKKFKGIEVIPIDLNANGTIDNDENFYQSLDSISAAIKNGKYPSPPSRDLYFVSKGKPMKKAVRDFITWIMSEGQKFVKESGYVELNNEFLKQEKNKLN